MVDQFPEIDGFFDHYGTSVFHCATCDGYEAGGRSVVILGWGEQVVAFAAGLLDWAADVCVVTEGHPLEGDERHRAVLARHGIGLVEDDAIALVGERGALKGVRLAGGRVLDADLVFFSIAHRPRLELALELGCETDESDCLCVDRDGRTSVDGCYAAGDITPGFQLVAVAVGKGAAVGVAAGWRRRSHSRARRARRCRPRRRPTPPPSWPGASPTPGGRYDMGKLQARFAGPVIDTGHNAVEMAHFYATSRLARCRSGPQGWWAIIRSPDERLKIEFAGSRSIARLFGPTPTASSR